MSLNQALANANAGSGIYVMSRKQVGEAYRAAKRVKLEEATFWNRNKHKKKGAK
jgi:hypothetical protein